MSKCNCFCDCKSNSMQANDQNKKKLTITWQRLVSDGNTCPRCGSTEDELNKAVSQLKDKLDPLGIEIILDKEELTIEEFKKNPADSNRILLNGRLLEDIIDAKTGGSQCCGVCGDEKCRTLETKDGIHETIPAEIIVEAGLKIISEY